MPEGIPYASTNVVAGAGLDLNYVGIHCFAYSGEISVNNSEVTLLEFTTSNDVIFGECQNGFVADSGDNMLFKLYLNGIIVFGYAAPSASETSTPYGNYEIVLPPNTNVKMTAENVGSSSSRPIVGKFVGRIVSK